MNIWISLFYVFVIVVSYVSFRQTILENSNVKKLDFPSVVIVLIAATHVPETILDFYKSCIKPML